MKNLGAVDGYLKIKTKIDNNEVDKDIQNLENKIKKLQQSNSENSQQESILQGQIDKYEELKQKAEEYRQKIKETQAALDGYKGRNLTSAELPRYSGLHDTLSSTQKEYSKITNEIDKQANKLSTVELKLQKIKGKQQENNAKISEYTRKIEQIKTDKIKNSVDSVGKSLQGQIGKISKMAMAVVGIRTAWMGVRRVISLVQQYNPQISADLEYMGYAIAQIFLPIVQKLVNILYTVLNYVNAIMSAWFGINLFSNASVKNFKKMIGTAKEIKNSLAGFDEMNTLQDSSSSSSSGSAMPSMELSKGLQGDVPAWLQWIIDNKDLILAILRRNRSSNSFY